PTSWLNTRSRSAQMQEPGSSTSITSHGAGGSRRPGRLRARLLWLAAAALVVSAGRADAAPIASNLVTVTTAAGTITLASRVYAEAPGDPSRRLFEYELTGDWNPEPGVTNGISSLKILFGDLLEDVADTSAPAGWQLDGLVVMPPFGVGFDLPGPTFGVGPNGGAVFSFTAPAGTGWTDAFFGSFVATHEGSFLLDPVDLLDGAEGHGPLVPVLASTPEPGALALLALGLARLARRRR